jgi:hypothetical protein
MTDEEDSETDDVERIERTDVGASIQVEVTRGEGTRDQEKWRLKGKGEDALTAMAHFQHEVKAAFGEDVAVGEDAPPLAEQLRQFQPEPEPEEDDEQDGEDSD